MAPVLHERELHSRWLAKNCVAFFLGYPSPLADIQVRCNPLAQQPTGQGNAVGWVDWIGRNRELEDFVAALS